MEDVVRGRPTNTRHFVHIIRRIVDFLPAKSHFSARSRNLIESFKVTNATEAENPEQLNMVDVDSD